MNRTCEIILIAAMARNRAIGRDNALPWRLRADLRHFKEQTLGQPVLMGRKTWLSLGRPLPGRRNVVLSRDPDFRPLGAEAYPNIEAALSALAGSRQVFVIGGAEIYRQTLAIADRLILTEVDAEIAGDAFFPTVSSGDFEEVSRRRYSADDDNEFDYAFVEYRRLRRPDNMQSNQEAIH